VVRSICEGAAIWLRARQHLVLVTTRPRAFRVFTQAGNDLTLLRECGHLVEIAAKAGKLDRVGGVVRADPGHDAGPVGFDIDSGRKDLRAMLAEGQSRGIDLPVTKAALACFDEASARGIGPKDGSSLAVYWSERKKG